MGSKESPLGRAKGWIKRWGPVLGWMGLIFFLSAQPKLPDIPGFDDLIDKLTKVSISDKIKHFVAYAALAALAWRAQDRKTSKWRRTAIMIGVAAAFGATDEWHQKYVPGRGCDVLDWTADVLGAATAAIILIRNKRDRRR